MAENNHVITVMNVGVLVALICLSTTFTNVAAQSASSCKADSITIKDAVTGSVQCQDCLKCPAGEGLSVKCGDLIDSQTPLMCKPCVLGETYSSAYEAGACKDCKNCGPYRETIKACTLTSKAVCGKCKVAAYEEPMLSMCKPCSSCCNDGKDIVISQCQVPGVPANKQCSFARSGKCSKVVTTASVSTATPALETTWPSTVPITHNGTEGTIPVFEKSAGKQLVYPTDSPTNGPTNGPTNSPSLNWEVIAGMASAIGGGVLILVAVLAAFKYFKAKRNQVCKNDDDIEMQRIQQANNEINDSGGGEEDEANPEDALLENTQVLPISVEEALDSTLLTGTQDDIEMQQVRDELDEPNPEDALLENTQVPLSVQEVQETLHSPLLTGTQDDIEMQQVRDEVHEPNPEIDAPLEDTQVSFGVEETVDSPLPTGTEETQPPGSHGSTDIKTIEEPRPEPSCEHHIHTKIQKTTVKETTETRVTCTTPKCVKGCRCQL